MFTCCTIDSSVINLIYSGQLQFSHTTLNMKITTATLSLTTLSAYAECRNAYSLL